MLNQKRFVKVVAGSKKSKDVWEGFRPDNSQTGDWAGRTHAEANTNGDNLPDTFTGELPLPHRHPCPTDTPSPQTPLPHGTDPHWQSLLYY